VLGLRFVVTVNLFRSELVLGLWLGFRIRVTVRAKVYG